MYGNILTIFTATMRRSKHCSTVSKRIDSKDEGPQSNPGGFQLRGVYRSFIRSEPGINLKGVKCAVSETGIEVHGALGTWTRSTPIPHLIPFRQPSLQPRQNLSKTKKSGVII